MNDTTPTHQPEARELLPCPMDRWVTYAKRGGLLDENGIAPDRMKAQTAFYAFSEAWNESHRAVVAALATQPPAAPAQVGTSELALEQERQKFQQETRRTSELSALLREFIKCLPEHEVGPWSRDCDLCRLVTQADALLKRPINVAEVGTSGASAEVERLAEDALQKLSIAMCAQADGRQAGDYSEAKRAHTLAEAAIRRIAEHLGPEAMAPAAPVAAVGEAVGEDEPMRSRWPLDAAANMLTAYAELVRATGRYAEEHYLPEVQCVIEELRAAHGILPAASMGAK